VKRLPNSGVILSTKYIYMVPILSNYWALWELRKCKENWAVKQRYLVITCILCKSLLCLLLVETERNILGPNVHMRVEFTGQ
jgi:hypothetical protein